MLKIGFKMNSKIGDNNKINKALNDFEIVHKQIQ